MSRAPDEHVAEHVTEHVTAAPLLWPLKKDTSYFKMTPKGAGSSKMSEKNVLNGLQVAPEGRP